MKRKILTLLAFSFSIVVQSQFLKDKDSIENFEGYFDFHYDQKKDAIYLEVEDLDAEFLYSHFLTSGVGSNDIGLDRGQLGGEAIVKFVKAGNKLLLVQPNMDYRAITDNKAEKESVAEAFAKSVIFGFEIKEQEEGKYLIDLTPFLMEDVHGVTDRLKQGDYGTYKLDKSKSALSLNRTKAFPENVEFEALLTFEGEPKSRTINSVVPDPKHITVTEHHSFVKLPDSNYKKRIFDPRSGAIFISYMDYASPVYEPIMKRFAIRHRLEKKDPTAEISEAVEPIVYYLDPGTPEPVKSALMEGASWWNEAFESIGYKNAFQVKVLPEGADPLDVRYNVIQWVHRSTRGWSYGASVVDPRTGEIIKGHVSLGSLRIRQDYMIAQALMNQPFKNSDDDHKPMMELALARIRQLAAHEVGHTLGFAHNFAASESDRSSVMDYPHPQFEMKNGKISFSNAYDTNIGEWDKITVAYSYGDIPEGETERQYLNSVLDEAKEQGLTFITDSDARSAGGAHAFAHLWDNGQNASEELNDVLEIRKQAIENFSEENIRTNEPFSVLEDVFVPLYFFHRYQTEATTKMIGGLKYTYAVKGDGNVAVEYLDSKSQENALEAVLKTLNAEVIAIPKNKLKLFPPRAFGYGRSRESFKSNTDVAFDAYGAPATAADMTLTYLLHPARAERLLQQHDINKNLMGLEAMLDEMLKETIQKTIKDDYLDGVQQTINFVVLKHLLNLAANKDATPMTKAVVNMEVDKLESWLSGKEGSVDKEMYRKIHEFRERPEEFQFELNIPKIPDGSPIGTFE